MIKTILKATVFVAIFLLIFAALEFGLSRIKNSYSNKKTCVENNLAKIDLLIFGSSQAYYGIDPTILSPNSCNLANSNQDLYYDQQILAKYLDNLPNLKTVIIPISYFSLEFRLANTEESWRSFFYSRYFKITNTQPFDIRNYSLIFLYTPQNSLSYILKGFRVNLVENDTANGWKNSNGNDPALMSFDGKANALRETGYMNPALRNMNIQILESMISHLKQRGVRVVLVTLPATKTYSDNLNSEKYREMQNDLSNLVKKDSLTYLNYLKDSRFEEDDFIDHADHLNANGANKLSRIIKQTLD